MKVCTCFLLFGVLAFTDSISQPEQHLAPNADSEYSIVEHSGKPKNLDIDHNFKTTVTEESKNLKLVFRSPKFESFTDFIRETVVILSIFDDSAFEDFVYILDKEIRNYHYKGCKFSELTENHDTRNLLMQTLKMIRWKPVAFTKSNINEVADKLRHETYDKHIKNLLDYINSLYRNSKDKLYRVLYNLNHYRKKKISKTHHDLVQVIRDGIRTVFFDHYSELDTNTRRELMERIDIFWEKYKKSANTEPEISHVDNDSVHEPDKNFKVSKNLMNDVKVSKIHTKMYTQTNLKNGLQRVVSKQIKYKHSQDTEIEEGMNNNEHRIQATEYTAEELLSRQSFDSSPDSIKLSQERHEEYNTQRYMSLYTEEISHKPRTTKKTKNIPVSANVMSRRHKIHRRPTTTPKYRPRGMMSGRNQKMKMLRMKYDMDNNKQPIEPGLHHETDNALVSELKHKPRGQPHLYQQHRQSDKLRSRSRHASAQIHSQYDAVIDVQLANTAFLESLRMLAPVEATKYDKSSYARSAAQRRVQTECKPQNPEFHHRKPVYELRRSITPPPYHKKYTKDKDPTNKPQLRQSDNNTKLNYVFDEELIKRFNDLENELNELKQMHNIRSKVYENNTDSSQASNDTVKRQNIYIERTLNTNHGVDNNNFIRESNSEHNINSSIVNNKSFSKNNTSDEPKTITNDANNATAIQNKTNSEGTNNNVNISKTDTEELNKEIISGNVTSTERNQEVTESMTAEIDNTLPPVELPKSNVAYSKPAYYDYPDRRIDPFDHINDGLDLNM